MIRRQTRAVVEDRLESLNPFSDVSEAAGLASSLAALDELDAEANMPEGVEPPLWERLCAARLV